MVYLLKIAPICFINIQILFSFIQLKVGDLSYKFLCIKTIVSVCRYATTSHKEAFIG